MNERVESPSVASARAAEAVGQLDPSLREAGKHRHPLFGEVLSRVGSSFGGKWRLDQLLGLGGMAAVYAATHRNGHRVAIKVLHPRHEGDKRVRERFRREAIVSNRVHHPGAVTVFDDEVGDEGSAFLVMELLEGESLERRLGRVGRVPLAEALALTDALLEVLTVAHDAGVLHRDLKPGNVFLTHEGQVKLLDFGVARHEALSERRGRTRLGAILGTPAFMAPEQARGAWDAVDERTDLWSVGANLFAMLTGAAVHEAPNEAATLVEAATRPAPPVSLFEPTLPPALAAFVDRALTFAPEGRFPDARTMRQALRDAAARAGDVDLAAARATLGDGARVSGETERLSDWDADGGDETARVQDPALLLAQLDRAAGRRPRARTSRYTDDFAQTSLFGDSMVREAQRPSFVDPPETEGGDREAHRLERRLEASLAPVSEVAPQRRRGASRVLVGLFVLVCFACGVALAIALER